VEVVLVLGGISALGLSDRSPVRLGVEEVDDPARPLALSIGIVNGHPSARSVVHVEDATREVGLVVVEVVHENDARLVSSVEHAPQLNGLDLDAGAGVDQHDGELGGAERGDHLADEVGRPGRVPEVDELVFPGKVREARVNRMRRSVSSAVQSLTVLPDSTVSAFGIAPAARSICSRKVVFAGLAMAGDGYCPVLSVLIHDERSLPFVRRPKWLWSIFVRSVVCIVKKIIYY
jgi:hypothetical protein